MRTQFAFALLGLSAFVLPGCPGGCASPTQVRLELITDIDCARIQAEPNVRKTLPFVIYVGPEGPSAEKPEPEIVPVASEGLCDPGPPGAAIPDRTFFLSPSAASDGPVAIRVVVGVRKDPKDCRNGDYTGCIVSRRQLTYFSGETVSLKINLRQDCEGEACTALSTCVAKDTCASSSLNSADCVEGKDCSDDVLVRCKKRPDGTLDCSNATPVGDGGTDGDVDTGPVIYTAAVEMNDIFATGDTTCVTQAGHLKCWGPNENGEFAGTPKTDAFPKTVFLQGGKDVLELASAPNDHKFFGARSTGGRSHMCTWFVANGSCWGRNDRGQLATDATNPVATTLPPGIAKFTSGDIPDVAITGAGIAKFAAGDAHTCFLGAPEAGNVDPVHCWGDDTKGQSSGTPSSVSTRLTKITLPGQGKPKDVATGFRHSCVVYDSNRLDCWGGNDSGETGQGNVTPTSGIGQVSGEFFAVAASATAGVGRTCAIGGASKQISCWGDNTGGILGLISSPGDKVNAPVAVRSSQGGGAIAGATSIAMGGTFACAIANGSLQCWGNNEFGQIGNGANGANAFATPVAWPKGAAAPFRFALGTNHGCALLENRKQVLCWGKNDKGQLGGTTSAPFSNVPVAITAL